jgi:hypothetical protein
MTNVLEICSDECNFFHHFILYSNNLPSIDEFNIETHYRFPQLAIPKLINGLGTSVKKCPN